MENQNLSLAQEVAQKIRYGAKHAFALSVRDQKSELTFGGNSVQDVSAFLWLVTSHSQIIQRTGAGDSFEFLFDLYGPEQASVRFALISKGELILDSQETPLAGFFTIRSLPGAKLPFCILGLLNHQGDRPASIFLADRTSDMIRYAELQADVITLLLERAASDD